MKSVNKSIRACVDDHNDLVKIHSCLAEQHISFEQVIRDDWPGWKKRLEQSSQDSIRRKAIDCYQLMQCARTEMHMCRNEMNNVLEHFNAQHAQLMQSISQMSDTPSSPLTLANKSRLISRVIEIEAQVTIARQYFPADVCDKHAHPDCYHSNFVKSLREYDCYTPCDQKLMADIVDECDEDEQVDDDCLQGTDDSDLDECELMSDLESDDEP